MRQTWYEVVVMEECEGAPHATDRAGVRSLLDAKGAVCRFMGLYPTARMIFVRHHFNRPGDPERYRIEHQLTVNRGVPRHPEVLARRALR